MRIFYILISKNLLIEKTYININQTRKTKLNMKKIQQIEEILNSIKKSYSTSNNQQLIDSLIKIPREDLQLLSKRIIQFLFSYNFVILNPQSINSLRHYFPKKDFDTLSFFNNLKDILKTIDIKIKAVKDSKSPTYFYFDDYKSLFNFLLFWDDNWGEFPPSNIDPLKKFIDNFDMYVNLNEDFIQKIFGENGIIKKNNFTITKFFDKIINLANFERKEDYQRHTLYKWRNEKYLPLSVFYDLVHSEYSEGIKDHFFNYITSIKIGRTSENNVIGIKILYLIEKAENSIFKKLFPFSSSIPGWLLNFKAKQKKKRLNFLQIFESFLKENTEYFPEEEILNNIRDNLKRDYLSTNISKLTIINFKSIKNLKASFHKGVNIIYGKNGSGKTSILQSIMFVLFIYYDIFDTSFITSGKNRSRVRLEVDKENKKLAIERCIEIDGSQTFTLEKLTTDNKVQLKFNKSVLFQNDVKILDRKEIEKKDKFPHLIVKIINEHLSSWGLNFLFSEIFLYYSSEYSSFEYWLEEEYSDSPYYNEEDFYPKGDLMEVYRDKFLLGFLNTYSEEYDEKIELKNKEIEELIKVNFSDTSLYNKINRNFFKSIEIGKEKCVVHGGVIEDPGFICNQCFSKYCKDCAISINECVSCREVSLINFIDYQRRIYSLKDIKTLFNKLEVKYSKELFSKTPTYYSHNIVITPDLMKRTYFALKNPFLEYIFNFFDFYLSRESESSELKPFKLSKIKNFIKLTKAFSQYHIIHFLSISLTIKILNYDNRISSKLKEKYHNYLTNILINVFTSISENKEDFKSFILDFYPFEKKILYFISVFFKLVNTSLFTEKEMKYNYDEKTHLSIRKYIDLIQPYFEEYDDYLSFHFMINGIKLNYSLYLETYSSLKPHIIDYDSFKFQLKNQMNLLSEYNSLKRLEKEKEELQLISSFIWKCFEHLYEKCLEYLVKRFKSEFAENFKTENFKAFLDKTGVPYISFNNSERIFPITILSGAEKNKLLLILFSLLNDFSEQKSFYLIDEPNELLDPDNVDIVKQFFLNFFNERQLFICTFLQKYKNFQPALVYEVWKDYSNVSHIFQHNVDNKIFEYYKSLDEIEKKIEKDPKDYYYHQKKLVLLLKFEKYSEALDYFHKIKNFKLDTFGTDELESFLSKITELEKDKEQKAKFYRTRALTFYHLKELYQAIEDIDKAIKLGSNIPEVYEFKSHCLLYINKPHKALATLEEGISKFPDHTGFYSINSDLLENLGRDEEALAEINKAIEIDVDKEWNYYQRAKVFYKLERYSEALEDINKAREADPDNFVYIQDKISILEELNRVDEAIELLDREKDRLGYLSGPDQIKAQLYQTKAKNLLSSGENEEAINIIKKAINLADDWAEFYHTYGEILMSSKNYEDALIQFEKAKELHFTPIKTYIKIGKCLLEFGRYEEALKNLKIGRNSAVHSVKSSSLTENDKRITVDAPQTELIKEAEQYISEVEQKIKEKK